VFKKFTLNSCRQIVPLHDDCGAILRGHWPCSGVCVCGQASLSIKFLHKLES
jgi:hypothetical protein